MEQMSPMEAMIVRAAAAMDANDTAAMLNITDDVLARDPVNPEGLFIAGMAFFRMKNHGLATVLLNAASQVKPGEPGLWNNLGCVLEHWHPNDALACMERALDLTPGYAPALKNTVGVLMHLGRWQEALDLAEQYLAQVPDDRDTEYHSALVLMQLGRWKEAWPRWRAGLGDNRDHGRLERNYLDGAPMPRWEGQSDAKVVIYGEQGLGDEILAASMYGKVKATGAEIIIECDPRLEGLLARSFPEFMVYGSRREAKPAWVEDEKPTHRLESFGLGELFAPEPYRVKPYLKADPGKRAMFRAWLDSLGPGLKVGLAWSGGVIDWDRADRNIPAGALGPIIKSEGCQFISLEYLDGPVPPGVHDAKWATAKGVDYDVTAALVAELDLVISVPTTVVELAGALGTPCWVMTPTVPNWRFAEAAGDTAWIYENVKIYRRLSANWLPVMAKVANHLRSRVRDQRPLKIVRAAE